MSPPENEEADETLAVHGAEVSVDLGRHELLQALDMEENIFWTREERAEMIRCSPGGLNLLGETLQEVFGPGEEHRDAWYSRRLEGLHLLEIIGLGAGRQEFRPRVAELLESLVVGRRDHGETDSSTRLAVGLRREALASLARVDDGRAIALYRGLPDARQREFFSHSLLYGLVDQGMAPGSAAALIRETNEQGRRN